MRKVRLTALQLSQLNFPGPPEEYSRYFSDRTNSHIERVRDNLHTIAEVYPGLSGQLLKRGRFHDASKFSKAERKFYVWLTWFHKCKNEGRKFSYPQADMEHFIAKATLRHIKANRHHPEFHKSPTVMSPVDLMEMVCDWKAMSQELGTNVNAWAEKSITKYEFEPKQVTLIRSILKALECNDG